MERQIPSGPSLSCADPTPAPNLTAPRLTCNLRKCRDGRPRPSRRAKRGAVGDADNTPSRIYPQSRLRRLLPRFATCHLAVYQEVVLNEEDGMKSPCAVNLHDGVTVSQQRLRKRVAQLSPARMNEACAALCFSLGYDANLTMGRSPSRPQVLSSDSAPGAYKPLPVP